MKICAKCGILKNLDDFHWRNKAKGTKAAWCKPCKQAYESEYYRNNDNRKRQIRQQSLNAYARNDEIILRYKAVGCKDCGEMNPIVLDFDHIEDNKLANVAELRGNSIEKLIAEIEKCDVVCANCHRVRTYNRRATGSSSVG